jgi:hypothetical protein
MRSIVFGSGWSGFATRIALPFLLLAMAGCGPGQGKVTGRVLYAGTPVPGGRVLFVPVTPGQNSVSALLTEGGDYEAVLPTGEVQVSVDNRELEPRPAIPHGIPRGLPGGAQAKIAEALKKEAMAAPAGSTENPRQKIPGKYLAIPKKYYDPKTSGIQFTVQRGDQKHDIELPK